MVPKSEDTVWNTWLTSEWLESPSMRSGTRVVEARGVQEPLDCWELVLWRNEGFLNVWSRWLSRCHWWCAGPNQHPDVSLLALPLPMEIYRVWEEGHDFWQTQHQKKCPAAPESIKAIVSITPSLKASLTGTLTHFEELNDWLTAEEACCLGLVGQEIFTWLAWPQ